MKKLDKNAKILMTASIMGILLLTSACAEKRVREEAAHEHAHSLSHGHMTSLEQAVEQASSPADHARVAARYEEEAAKLLKLAKRHENLAEIYEKTDNPKMGGNSARHCRSIAGHLRQVAQEMKSLAAMHRQMAGQ